MKHKLVWCFSLIFLASHLAKAAACCGGGFATPAIISSDDKAQLTSSISNTEVIVDNVDSNGVWRSWDTHQKIQTLKIEAAHIFWDRYQAGFSIPVIQRSRKNQNYSGLGDTSASLGYEYLPDWNYNPWRPKGIGYLQLTFPTGKSRADSEVGGLDSRGNGFWAFALGTLLTKSWSRFDSYLSFDIHRSLGKEISNSQFSGKLEPGFGGNLGVGLGYNFKEYRIGSGITWTYEDPIQTTSNSGSIDNGFVERYATAIMNISYLASDEWSGTFSYTDQTLFGAPVNTSLGRGVLLQLQRRWGR